MLFVNFKTYKKGTGQKAVELVRLLSEVEELTGISVVPAVQAVDARECVNASDHEVWVQHTDSVEPGQHTGWILPEGVAEAGVKGTFLNHSEHRVPDGTLQAIIERCREVGLNTLVFASDLEELRKVVELKPDFVAYEPPELIASKETSVAKAKPEVIEQAVEIAQKAGIPLIVGAGVKDVEDVKGSLRAGAVGVAASSAVVLADDPRTVLRDLAEGFKGVALDKA